MDYSNGKIYQLLNSVTQDVYVGSTCSSLSKRFYNHRINMKFQGCEVYKKMKEIGADNFYIELIEAYPCNSKSELNAREGHYIRERGTLNMCIAGRSQKQYKLDNREQVLAEKRDYYKNNKESIANKQNVKHLCECGCTYTHVNKARHMRSIKHIQSTNEL